MKKKSLFTKSISIMLKLLIVLGIIVLGFGSILLHLYNTEGKNKLQSIIEQKAGLNDTLFFFD